jgi:hypothetical protein
MAERSEEMRTKAEYEAAICERLSQAQSVPSFREVSFADGDFPKLSGCHPNVNRYVSENSGTTAVRGWVTYREVWDGDSIKQELTAHSVVRSTDGQLFDITRFGDERVRRSTLFVPHLGDDQEFFSMGSFLRCPCGGGGGN